MATTTLTYPDEARPLIVAAFAAAYGYQPTIPDPNNPGNTIPNPVSPEKFAEQCVVAYVRDIARSHLKKRKVALAQQQADQEAADEVDNIPVTVETK
jgi:hypothetical protein